MWIETLISMSEWLFLLYFLGLTAGYLMLDLIAIVHLRQYLQERVLESLPHSYTGFEPPPSRAPFGRCCNSATRNMKSS